MSESILTLHFRNEETLRGLERAAEALGVSKDELAETAIERELAAVDLEGGLVRSLDRLKSYSPEDLEHDIREFARSEVEFQDPFKARLVESQDAYGIGALFGHPVERG